MEKIHWNIVNVWIFVAIITIATCNNKISDNLVEKVNYFNNYDSFDDTYNEQVQTDQNWDLLIFTQQWPVTTCYHWREEDKNHSCTLPTEKEFWTIHGVWPTKLGHLGPNFCNASAKFDMKKIEIIKDGLLEYWPDIEDRGYDSLWQHEWLKHGTCAMSLDKLDNEFKYFNQGLKWREEYVISRFLDKVNIFPGTQISNIMTIISALVNELNVYPSIHCIYDPRTKLHYLSEVRMCFDKGLNLIDCDGVVLATEGDIRVVENGLLKGITNCPTNETIVFPSNVPIQPPRRRLRKQSNPIVEIYKLLQFIMWFTL